MLGERKDKQSGFVVEFYGGVRRINADSMAQAAWVIADLIKNAGLGVEEQKVEVFVDGKKVEVVELMPLILKKMNIGGNLLQRWEIVADLLESSEKIDMELIFGILMIIGATAGYGSYFLLSHITKFLNGEVTLILETLVPALLIIIGIIIGPVPLMRARKNNNENRESVLESQRILIDDTVDGAEETIGTEDAELLRNFLANLFPKEEE